MHIGIYDPYLDDAGGGEKYMMTIAECLAKNHQVDVFWDTKSDFEAVKKRFALDLEGVEVKKNIFAPHVSILSRLRETKKYDAIIVLSDGSIPLVFSKKLFLHIQQPLLQLKTLSWKNKLKLTRVTRFFYNSQFTQLFNDQFLKGVKTSVIYPPVDVKIKKVSKENIIMHVGRFRTANIRNEDYKKQQTMVNAFKQMIDDGLKNWKFVIGTSINNTDDILFNAMLDSAKGFPIEFLVNKNNEELWSAYSKAKIYWHASGFGEDLEKHPEYAEHFGISTVEAMGAGAVPVVINAGGQKEIIVDGKDGFLWKTLDELREKTKMLIEDAPLWESMSSAAQEKAKEFSKEKFDEAIHELVEIK